MFKTHYFSIKFSKNVPETSILVTWSCVICPNCGFSN